MPKQMDYVPVYFIAGFLNSGKTNLVKNMLTDEYFSAGEKTLLIVCEEGEEEYDSGSLQAGNAVMVNLESIEEMDNGGLVKLDKEYKPERVIIEFNSTWNIQKLQTVPLPDNWEMAQTVCMVEAPTFDLYLTNMRAMITEPMKLADLVIFNRCDENTTKSAYRRMVKALVPQATIVFENVDGTSDDGVADEDLPYDVHAPLIEIQDDQFGIWYMDALEHPDRYDGKKLRVKGRTFSAKGGPAGYFVFGRRAMTCCANDIRPIGFLVKSPSKLPDGWFYLTAQAKKGFSALHRGDAILLTKEKVEAAPPPADEVVSFN